jgi:hypothetical protein
MFIQPFAAKGSTLKVLIIARISTVNQDPRSLDAQIELCKKFVNERYKGPVEFFDIASQGSGERLDRVELIEAENRIESRKYDLVISEDLGRIVRRSRAIDFCESCEDCETRMIAINDGIDTVDKKWRRNAYFAAMKHEESNEDTSDRIKRQMDHNFISNGGCVNNFPWGLVKPPGCKSDAELYWTPEARSLIPELFNKLENSNASYNLLARWMRERGADGMSPKKLARLIHNPIVCGYRRRGIHRTRRFNQTGRRRAIVAPEDQIIKRHCAHLQLIEPAQFDRVNRLLAERNAQYKVGADGIDPRKGRPKRRTTWPGQQLICGICGRFFNWGGHGQPNHLVCAGVKDYKCWNTTSVNGSISRTRIAQAILTEIMSLRGFDEMLVAEFRAKAETAGAERGARRKKLEDEWTKLSDQIRKLIDSIAEDGNLKSLKEAVRQREEQLTRIEDDLEIIKRTPLPKIELPPMQTLKDNVKTAFEQMLAEPGEVPDLIKTLVPEIILVPHRLYDSGHTVLRAVIELHLAGFVSSQEISQELEELLKRRIVVDLFDSPQREAIRKRVQVLIQCEPCRTLKEIAKELGVTETAVQRSVALQKALSANRVADPHIRVTEPPENARQRMHRHPDYLFEPLPGFTPPNLDQ